MGGVEPWAGTMRVGFFMATLLFLKILHYHGCVVSSEEFVI